MWNIIVGIILIVLGLSGRFRLPFTSSPTPLIVVGVILVIWGGWQMWQRYDKRR